MNDFPMIKATKRSVTLRRLVWGVGINDSDYQTQPTVGGKRFMCSYYMVWRGMLQRCYSPEFQNKNPTYKGCIVDNEWLTFSNFKNWMSLQRWEGLALDKDILVPGNKLYSPKTCRFVPLKINSLLNDHAAKRGNFPIGVSFHKATGKYQSECSENGKTVYLGRFNTPEAAHAAYKTHKSKVIRAIATDPNESISIYVRLGLLKRAA